MVTEKTVNRRFLRNNPLTYTFSLSLASWNDLLYRPVFGDNAGFKLVRILQHFREKHHLAFFTFELALGTGYYRDHI